HQGPGARGPSRRCAPDRDAGAEPRRSRRGAGRDQERSHHPPREPHRSGAAPRARRARAEPRRGRGPRFRFASRERSAPVGYRSRTMEGSVVTAFRRRWREPTRRYALGVTVLALGGLGFLPQIAGPGYDSALVSGLVLPALVAVTA